MILDSQKKIWRAKTIKIVYKNEGPKNFGQPNVFLVGQKKIGRADGIGISQKIFFKNMLGGVGR